VDVGDWEQLGTHLEHLPANGVHVLELVTDRKMDAATRKQIFAELAAEL
jgi:2-succinyl-5-enolpyruvyl-6-hydroxy-3-cyclohexene-1-carboxylate synthase